VTVLAVPWNQAKEAALLYVFTQVLSLI